MPLSENRSVATARTFLFVPGSRPDRFGSAMAAGADAVVFDLEDAVVPNDKEVARKAVFATLRELPGHGTVVRVNPVGSPWHDEDVDMVLARGATLMLPKTESAAELEGLPPGGGAEPSVIALVETPRGVVRSAEIASHRRVVRLAFGSLDLAAELGVDPSDTQALFASRSQLVLASAAADLHPPIDGVTVAVRDGGRLREDLSHARRLGFGGKLCIHPVQVGAAANEFGPAPEEVDWAARVLAAVDDTGRLEVGVVVVDGRMVDAPVVKRARRILDAADIPTHGRHEEHT